MDIQKFRSIREEKIKSLIEKLDKIQKNIESEINAKKVDILQIQAKRIENQMMNKSKLNTICILLLPNIISK